MRFGAKYTVILPVFLVVLWLGLRFLLPLMLPFLLGLALALAAEPAVDFLCRKAHLPRGLATGLGVSAAFCCICLILLLLCAFGVRELRHLVRVLPDLEDAALTGLSSLRQWMDLAAGRMPASIQPLVQQNVDAVFSDGTTLVNQGIRKVLSLAGNLLTQVPDSALGLGSAIISGFMISAKLPQLRRRIKKWLPKEKLKPLLQALNQLKNAVGGWLLAQLKLTVVTLSILLAGLLLLRIPNAPLWALGISLVDAFPVLGTGTVLLPWAFLSFLQRDLPRALGIAGIYTVITITRSVLEPRLLGKQLGLDPLVTLISIYIGYKLLGLVGMILAPLAAVTVRQFFPEPAEG